MAPLPPRAPALPRPRPALTLRRPQILSSMGLDTQPLAVSFLALLGLNAGFLGLYYMALRCIPQTPSQDC